jgi:hypothetical protein
MDSRALRLFCKHAISLTTIASKLAPAKPPTGKKKAKLPCVSLVLSSDEHGKTPHAS